MFIGDFKVFPSLLKMAGAAVLYGFRPTNEHLPEFGAGMSNCNLNHFGNCNPPKVPFEHFPDTLSLFWIMLISDSYQV